MKNHIWRPKIWGSYEAYPGVALAEVHELVKYFMMISFEHLRMMGEERVNHRMVQLRAYELEFFRRFGEWPYRFELFTNEVMSETDALRAALTQRVLVSPLGFEALHTRPLMQFDNGHFA